MPTHHPMKLLKLKKKSDLLVLALFANEKQRFPVFIPHPYNCVHLFDLQREPLCSHRSLHLLLSDLH